MSKQSLRKRQRVAILEFVTGGGMASQQISEIPTSLLQEGRAMLRALATDWASLPDWDVWICWDARLGAVEMTNVMVRRLNSSESFLDVWRELANEVDYVVVVAPEIDQQLATITDAIRTSGTYILNADSLFIEAASDKLLTAHYLQRAKVSHPRTQRFIDFIDENSIAEDAAMCSDARTGRSVRSTLGAKETLAWAIKPRDGAGCLDVFRIDSLTEIQRLVRDRTQAGCDWSRYLIQPWIEGAAGSVAVLCGPDRLCVLPAMSQKLFLDACNPQSMVEYCGGEGPFRNDLQSQIEAFAVRVIRSLPGHPVGWVGIDFVVAESCSLNDSIVAIEVNPRLTTSYLGLREILSENLAGLLFQVGLGQEIQISMSGRATTFDPFGMSTNDEL